MANTAVTTHLNQQTIEQRLLDIDPSITFGRLGDADNPIVFGTATARTILPTPGLPIQAITLTPWDTRMRYRVEFRPTDQQPSFSNYRWSDHLGDVPTRVVFALGDVKNVGEVR